MEALIIVACIAAIASIVAAGINAWGNRRNWSVQQETFGIVKGNGKGDVAQMNEKILAIAVNMERTICARMDRLDTFVDRQDRHNERQDEKMDKLTGRVEVIEIVGYRRALQAEANIERLDHHLTKQDAAHLPSSDSLHDGTPALGE